MKPLAARCLVCATCLALGWAGYAWMLGAPREGLLTAQQALRLEVNLAKQGQQLREQIQKARQRLDADPQPSSGALGLSSLFDALSRDLDDLAVGERRWKLDPAVAGPGYREQVVGASFACSFDTLGRLLQRIDEYPGGVRVSQLVTRRQATGQLLDVTLALVNHEPATQNITHGTEASP